MEARTTQDPGLENLINKIQDGIVYSPYVINNGVLFYEDRLVVPIHLIEEVLSNYHERNAHMARNRLLAILKTRFFWINMHTHICDWVNACIKCKQIKPDRALHNV